MTDKNYDSEFCGRVPLHQTNMIQPHGVLMLLEKGTGTILQVSENIKELLGIEARDMVQTPFAHYVTDKQHQLLQKRFETFVSGKIPFTFTINQGGNTRPVLALAQSLEPYLMLEIEIDSMQEAQDSFISVYQELKVVLSAIEAAGTIEEAVQITAKELKRISGFDKVMIYRFDEAWNGTVIAEEREEEMDAYLGLKFPASDVPKGARDMYRKNPYRLIPNAAYQPVRLYPVINPVTHAFTDLSDAHLRSVAAVHIEYLHNMKVTASMSTRILKNNELWGLISCHHRTPKYLSYQTCSLFELLSGTISAKIASVEQQSHARVIADKHQLYAQVVEQLYQYENLWAGVQAQHQNLMHLLGATGLALVQQKEIQTFGHTPGAADIEDLVFWLQAGYNGHVIQETNLAGRMDHAAAYAEKASGLLALPIQPEKGSYLLAFRPEAVREVTWGGNPDEAIRFSEDRKSYHPRASFQQWQQTVRQQAVPWQKEDLEIAEQFKNFAVAFTLNKIA